MQGSIIGREFATNFRNVEWFSNQHASESPRGRFKLGMAPWFAFLASSQVMLTQLVLKKRPEGESKTLASSGGVAKMPQAIRGKQTESSESCQNLERGREGYLERGRLLVEAEATFQDRDWGQPFPSSSLLPPFFSLHLTGPTQQRWWGSKGSVSQREHKMGQGESGSRGSTWLV